MQHLIFRKKLMCLDWIRGEQLKRFIFIKFYLKKQLLKSLLTYSKKRYLISKKSKKNIKIRGFRGYIQYKLSKFSNYSKITQQKSRCAVTGRSHMVFRSSLLSRMQIRKYGRDGFLPHLGHAVF